MEELNDQFVSKRMSNNISSYLTSIRSLNKDSVPSWGNMKAQQMVEHLLNVVKISTEKIEISLGSDEKKLPTLKKILMSNRPFPKGFSNPAIGSNLPPLVYSNLAESIDQLENEISYYYEFFEKFPAKKTLNPTFGFLNKEEWDKFHEKHFIHHLTQFSLLP
jgi:hypothetical protein